MASHLIQSQSGLGLESPISGRRENNFDALRLIAALCVVVEHAAVHLDGRFLWYTPSNGLWFFDGVAVFFILSGGMVYASAEKCREQNRPMRDYLLNRLLRITPAIYAYLLFMIIIILALRVVGIRSLADPEFMAWAASNLLLMPVYHPAMLQHFGTGVMNGSLWTITAEVGFYLVVPVLVWMATRYGFRKMVLSAFTVGAVGLATYAILGGHNTDRTPVKLLGVTFLPWLGYFMIGIVATKLWKRLPQHWMFAVAALAIYLGVWACRRSVDDAASLVLTLAGAVPLAYLAFWVGYRGPAILRRTTAKLGDLSFGAYIWHMPFVNAVIWSGAKDGPVGGAILVALVVAVSLMFAFVSWHLVEKPALKLKRYTSRPVGTA